MITTGPLSVVMPSSGVTDQSEPLVRGIRVVKVQSDPNGGPGEMTHEYLVLDEN